MEKLLDIALKNRKILQYYLLKTQKEDLFKVPKGFNNNIWWNIAHVVVTPQLLVYNLSGLDFTIEEELINKYRKGTFPEGKPSAEEVEKITEYLFSTLETIKEDYKQGKFNNYKEYMTSPKVVLQSVQDALSFNVFHEGLHLGAILALKKALATEN
ncbi:damage-inducible protein DinB [Flagellimonas aquimarina]|uniref:Damage-inducible protein DinB n=1 Tax=Flagellimonas aquimarina TaxID=2201895 RepID=A0A316L1X7_9FLAO|nr:DinB family protein [Allomuricauda koreensis]PWL40084.1 damage-inducible protein DinB [Allomuricauda koreensis]